MCGESCAGERLHYIGQDGKVKWVRGKVFGVQTVRGRASGDNVGHGETNGNNSVRVGRGRGGGVAHGMLACMPPMPAKTDSVLMVSLGDAQLPASNPITILRTPANLSLSTSEINPRRSRIPQTPWKNLSFVYTIILFCAIRMLINPARRDAAVSGKSGVIWGSRDSKLWVYVQGDFVFETNSTLTTL